MQQENHMTELNQLQPGLSPTEVAGCLARFPENVINTRGQFKYIPVEHVIDRLNQVFNYNWDSTQTYVELGAPRTDNKGNVLTPIYMGVSLRVKSTTGAVIEKVGFGGNVAGYGKGEGDGHKGAYSDALKKAAQALGIGLYLAIEGKAGRRSGGGGHNRGATAPTSAPNLSNNTQQVQAPGRAVPPPPRLG